MKLQIASAFLVCMLALSACASGENESVAAEANATHSGGYATAVGIVNVTLVEPEPSWDVTGLIGYTRFDFSGLFLYLSDLISAVLGI
jgi:hypothetical protein